MKLLLSNNKISAGFKPFRDLITSENKHFATAPLLGIILFACAFVVFRACGLFFEADDFRFLWWAFDRQAEPWKAFTDPPLFANYYRPVVSLLWWVHYQLFGVNEYLHHLALGIWWTAIFVLCFFWNQRKENSLSGFLACAVLISSWPLHELIQWKSWLTTISSLVLHLSALTVLLNYSKNRTQSKLAFFILLFLAASWAKESARFTILFTSLAFVLGSTDLKRPNKYKLSALIGILWLALFFTSSAVKGYAFSFSQFFFQFSTTIPNISYYADVIWGNTYVKVFAFLAVSLALLGDGWRHLWRIGLSACVASLLFCLTLYYNVPVHQGISLGLFVYLHGLWLTPYRKILRIPLIWLFVSFWPLALMPLLTIAYGANSAVALSLILGTLGLHALRTLISFSTAASRWRTFVFFHAPITLTFLFMLATLFTSLCHMAAWTHYREVAYSNPTKTILAKLERDLTGIRSWGTIYIEEGDRLGLEVFLSIYFNQNRFGYDVIPHPPTIPGCYRLSAYTKSYYHADPEEDPLNLWLPEKVGPVPEPDVLNDPYSLPERWDIAILGKCNSLEGWETDTRMWHSLYPIGQDYGYVNHELQWKIQPMRFTYHSSTPTSWLTAPDHAAFSCWLQSQRWSMIDTISIQLIHSEKTYVWDHVDPKITNTWHQWKRVKLDLAEASVIPTANTTENFIVVFSVKAKSAQDAVGTFLSIDEIRLAQEKPEWRDSDTLR